MPYLMLIIGVLSVSSSTVLCSLYNRNNDEGKAPTSFYNMAYVCCGFLCWMIIFFINGTYDWDIWWYALIFAVCYTACNYGFIEAIKTGVIAFTNLLLQLSFICVPIWGFFFWDTKFTLFVWIGLALVASSLALCLYRGKENGSKYSWKWLLCSLIAFVGNAGCSIIQRTQQINYNGQYGAFFMTLSMGISSVIGIIICFQSKGFEAKQILSKKWHFPVLAGGFNVLQHLIIIYLISSPLSPSLIYPSTAVGGLIVTTIFSTIVFKEKMRWWQWVGVLLGAVAIGALTL